MATDQLLEQKQAEKKEVKGYFETTVSTAGTASTATAMT